MELLRWVQTIKNTLPLNLCSQIFDMLLNGDLFKYGTYFYNATGSTNYFNVLRQAVCCTIIMQVVSSLLVCWYSRRWVWMDTT